MGINKKAIVFSLIAIGLSGLFILLFSTGLRDHINDQNKIVRTRINGLDQTITEFYTYAQAAQEIAGYEALKAMYQIVNNTSPPTYLLNFEDNLTKCMNNSEGCSNTLNLVHLINNYITIIEPTKSITLIFDITNITIYKESYWSITIDANISIELQDRYATWNYNEIIRSKILTTGIHDPGMLRLNTMYGGTTERKISPTAFNVDTGAKPDIGDIMDYYTIGQYHYSMNGSCLSQRFEGDWSNPTELCGIETIINPENHPGLLPPLNQDIAHIDWQARRGITYACTDLSNITSINQNFHLNSTDAEKYNIGDIGIPFSESYC